MQRHRLDAVREIPRAPESFIGYWRREFIRFPDGSTDQDTFVAWGQTGSLYVDLRIPRGRPIAAGRTSFDDFTREELLVIADQKGFAGHLEFDGDVCTWVRYIDFRPPTGRPDRGVLRVEGDTLWEHGEPTSVLGRSYEEVYHRRGVEQDLVALRLAEEECDDQTVSKARDAVLIVVGERFLLARGRTTALPKAETLRQLVEADCDDADAIRGYLDCEVSMGLATPAAPWVVERSTVPMREGAPLFPTRRLAASEASGELTLTADRWAQRWTVVESTWPSKDLARRFAIAP